MAVSPEVRLLLATTGGVAMDATIERLAAGPMRWDVFLGLVQLERAAAVVWRRLRRLVQDRMPAELFDGLGRAAVMQDIRMTMMGMRLDQTLAALAAARIPVLLLKGAALGKTVYGSLPRRPMLDLDLLVLEAQLDRAREVVLEAGWEAGPLEGERDFYRDHYHLPPYFDKGGADFSLELHNGLFFRGHPFNFDVGELWERSIPLDGTPQVRVPATTDMVLHLALHFAWSHTMRSATWRTLRDLRTLEESGAIDWEEVGLAARRSRAASCCYWVFRLARLWAGMTVPDELLDRLRPPIPEAVLPVLERHFAQQWYPVDLVCPSVRLELALWRIAVRPRWSGHGTVLPWQRNARFRHPEMPRRSHDDMPRKLHRHFGKLGAYMGYLRRILATDV
jgi:Uncharacterised nucleotidyltransferase